MVVRGSSFLKHLALIYLVSGLLGGLLLFNSCVDADYYEFYNPMTEEWDVTFLIFIGAACFLIATPVCGSIVAVLWLSGRLAWSSFRERSNGDDWGAENHHDA